MIIIGLTGHPSSGKDTIAHYLETKGFEHISTSDILREEMRKKGLSTERKQMHDFVNQMRALRGPGYLAEEAVKTVSGDTVISGLRSVGEVQVFKQKFGSQFVIFASDAPIKTRFAWAKGRGRDADGLTFEQFRAQEEAERHGDVNAQQVDDVVALSDHMIQNVGTKKELMEKVDLLLLELITKK